MSLNTVQTKSTVNLCITSLLLLSGEYNLHAMVQWSSTVTWVSFLISIAEYWHEYRKLLKAPVKVGICNIASNSSLACGWNWIILGNLPWSLISRARFQSLARSKLRLCSANHRAGYFSNLACDWLSIVWAYSKQDTENGPWFLAVPSHQEPCSWLS